MLKFEIVDCVNKKWTKLIALETTRCRQAVAPQLEPALVQLVEVITSARCRPSSCTYNHVRQTYRPAIQRGVCATSSATSARSGIAWVISRRIRLRRPKKKAIIRSVANRLLSGRLSLRNHMSRWVMMLMHQ